MRKGPESAHQLQDSILGAFLPRFLLMSFYQRPPPFSHLLSQLPGVLTSSPSEHPAPRFVSMDPTELIFGRAVVAPQYNISNLNASLPGLMELIRL